MHNEGVPQCTGMDVLEIGCGLGLPGLVAGARGAAHVTLADCDDRALERLESLDLSPSMWVSGALLLVVSDFELSQVLVGCVMRERRDDLLTVRVWAVCPPHLTHRLPSSAPFG